MPGQARWPQLEQMAARFGTENRERASAWTSTAGARNAFLMPALRMAVTGRCQGDDARALAEDWPCWQHRRPRARLAMHHDSSQLKACLDPVRGIRDLQLRRALYASSLPGLQPAPYPSRPFSA